MNDMTNHIVLGQVIFHWQPIPLAVGGSLVHCCATSPVLRLHLLEKGHAAGEKPLVEGVAPRHIVAYLGTAVSETCS
jgi:hypothetical protein